MFEISCMQQRTKRLLIAVAGVCALSLVGAAQDATLPASRVAQGQAAAATLMEWDVISVKPTDKCTAGSGMQITTDGVHMFCLPVRALIQIAWAINEGSRVFGAPVWAKEVMYDIDAKVAGEDAATFGKLKVGERNRMLQALLQRRFNLKAHLDSRELPVYDLVVAKGGPKLKEATPDEAAKAMLWLRSRGEIDSTSMPLHSLPSMLARELDRPVVDKTGLTGNYDFTLRFATATAATSDSQDDPSIFTAVREQLGLKLEPSKALLDVLIIDNLEKPTDN
jgi:uncharacterized protein (TIGR03435 family)